MMLAAAEAEVGSREKAGRGLRWVLNTPHKARVTGRPKTLELQLRGL